MRYIQKIFDRLEIVKDLFGFLWGHNLWWMIPIVAIMLLFVTLLFFGQTTGVAPFIYALF